MLLNTMRDRIRSCVLAAALAVACGANAQESIQTEAATIAFDNHGTCWLSFVLKRPKASDLGVKLKVVRPVPGAPEPGLPQAKLGSQGRGSWIWIGEGRERGRAGLFTLDAAGHVTWVVLTPRIAGKYLRPAGRGDYAGIGIISIMPPPGFCRAGHRSVRNP